jgi:predicted GNAT superfamily acetyltransferase
MDWILDDWEYPNDEIYAMERQKDIEAAMYQWEEQQMFKTRLPAIIKVVKPITKDEAKRKSSAVRGAHQTKLQS